LVYRRQKQDMPAFKDEVEMAVDKASPSWSCFLRLKSKSTPKNLCCPCRR
jgi:hypothetical protein